MQNKQMTVAQIAALLENDEIDETIINTLAKDDRISVHKLFNKWIKRREARVLEQQRLSALFCNERNYLEQGHTVVAGIDEAGRGPLAGPVVVGAVILPLDCYIPQLNDSKKLTARQREKVYLDIKEQAICAEYYIVDHDIIDNINIYQATVYGMYSVIDNLKQKPQAVLIDAVPLPQLEIPFLSLVGGDGLSASIAAASIIAKVTRDRLMLQYDEQYPQYGFRHHKGYGTPEHLAAIQKYGPCPIHRRSFEPMKSMGVV